MPSSSRSHERVSASSGASPASEVAMRARFRGCLLGGACGDALGAPVEFMSRSDILQAFGPDGIAAFAPAFGRRGAITDDTQMTLFTAEGLLRGAVSGDRGRGFHAALLRSVAQAYLRWLRTQGEMNLEGLDEEPVDGLAVLPELNARRGPGRTCLSALHAMRDLGAPARNHSKGCGGVMRMAPAGLFAAQAAAPMTPAATFDLGCDLAALTHGHPSGALPAGALAVLVRGLVLGDTLDDALRTAKDCLRRAPQHEETLAAILRAEAFAAVGEPPASAIAMLGGGWVAEEALAIALYSALIAPDFGDGVRTAVNHDGDSDSTGAITGNILGALWGEAAIPPDWLAELEAREVIVAMAEELLTTA